MVVENNGGSDLLLLMISPIPVCHIYQSEAHSVMLAVALGFVSMTVLLPPCATLADCAEHCHGPSFVVSAVKNKIVAGKHSYV